MSIKNLHNIPWTEPLVIKQAKWFNSFDEILRLPLGDELDTVKSRYLAGDNIQLLIIKNQGMMITELLTDNGTPTELFIWAGLGVGTKKVIPHFQNFCAKHRVVLSTYSNIPKVRKLFADLGFLETIKNRMEWEGWRNGWE